MRPIYIGPFVISKYYYKRQPWYRIQKKGKRSHHAHISHKESLKTVKMIAVRAKEGSIPRKKGYPDWMVISINRLWFGEDFAEREDLDNSDLFTADPRTRRVR